jgi:hypothetical protein
MGYLKFRKPILAYEGLANSSLATRSTDTYIYNPRVFEKIQTLTGASTGTAVTNYGITSIAVASSTEGTAANLIYSLAAPVAGITKTIIVDCGGSTKEVQVRTASSAQTFWGSTKNSLLFSTDSTGAVTAHLVGASTSKWFLTGVSALLPQSTAVTAHRVTIVGATA